MNKLLAACGFLLASAGTALAADPVYAPPTTHHALYSTTSAYDWSGLWVGAHAGYVSGAVTGTTFGTSTSGPSGADIGLHAYYNLQSGNWVYGPYFALPVVTATGTIGGFATMKLDWAAVGGLRVGYAIDRWLPYGILAGVVGGGSVSTGSPGSNTHVGYAIGAGVEYAINDRWSVGGRYAFVSMDKQTYGISGTPFGWDGHSVVGTLTFKLY